MCRPPEKIALIHGIIKLSMLYMCLACKLRNLLLHITETCAIQKPPFKLYHITTKEENWLTCTTHVFLQNTKIINTQKERQFVLANLQTKLIILSEKESKITKAARELTHRMIGHINGEYKLMNKGKKFKRWMRYSAKVISIIPIKHQYFSFCFFLSNSIIVRRCSRIKSSAHVLATTQQCILWIHCISFYLDCILELLLILLKQKRYQWFWIVLKMHGRILYILTSKVIQTLDIWWGVFCLCLV